MKSTRILLATLALSGAPLLATHSALAAPAAPVAPVAPVAAPVAPAPTTMNADAIALFDKAIKAYGALDKLSQTFTIVDSTGGVASPASGSGTLQIQKPGQARLEVKIGEDQMLFVSDGATLVTQMDATSYQKKATSEGHIASVVSGIPSAATIALGALLSGENPLNSEGGPQWENVKQVSFAGMPGVSMQLPTQEGRSPVVFQIFLDPKTDLVARVEATTSIVKKAGETPVPYSNLTTFTPDGGAITPATFQYTPPAGAKLVTEKERPKSYDPALVVGAKPFALTGKTLEGEPLSLEDYRGKVVLLDFWATWCGPCIGELPNVQTAYKTYNSKGFDIIGISLDEDEEALRGFVKEKAMAWPEIFDGKGWEAGDAKTYGVRAIPFTLLIGKDGNIAAVNPRGAALEPAIKAALAK